MDHSVPLPQFFKAPLEINQYQQMPFLPLGGSGLWTPRVGLGTWKFGRPETGDEARVDQPTALRIFDRALELGVTFWDTAPRYNNASGNSERVIGAWLRANPDQRRNVIIATKVYGGMDGLTPNHCRLTRGNIKESVYASLERMGAEYIDLFYFHHYDPLTPVEESYSAVEDLVQADLIRYLAVSNFTIEQLKQHQRMESVFGSRARVIAVQNQYDILRKEPAEYAGVLDYLRPQACHFIAYSPLAEGFLTERYLDLAQVRSGDRIFDQGMLPQLATPENLEKLRQLAGLAQAWGMQLSQLALAYTLTIPGMGPVIPAASSVRQLESNAKAGQIELSEEQRAQVKQVVE
ncbi:MAG TPA: aldo/keto reductase [Anaerolineaceae bacterium]|nr:aldo/keto reductase [Anaerolineaceae bacterium]